MKKVALITGGAGGIGFAIASSFLREGYAVAIIDRDLAREAAVLEALTPLGQAIFKTFDLSLINGYPALIQEITSELGRIDVLVNNAAYSTRGKMEDITPLEWDQYLRVNLSAAFFMAQTVAPEIEKQAAAQSSIFHRCAPCWQMAVICSIASPKVDWWR